MIDIAELVLLQEIDLRLDAVHQQLQATASELGQNSHLPALRAEFEAQGTLLSEEERARRAAEAEAEAFRAKIKTEEAKLYGGTITDARELRHLQEEIYALRRTLKQREETLLGLMESEEALRAVQAYLQRLMDGAEALWATHAQELQGRQAVLAAHAEALQAEVAEQRDAIDQQSLSIYDQQRQRMAVAVARVVGGACGHCRLTLPLTAINRARRRDEAVRCPACQCLIYVT